LPKFLWQIYFNVSKRNRSGLVEASRSLFDEVVTTVVFDTNQ